MSAADGTVSGEVLASRVRHFREQIADRKVEITLDRDDLLWMLAIEGDEGAEGGDRHSPSMSEERLDHFAVAIAAKRILTERDSTFWPRLRKLGPTPEIVAEANNILGWRTVKAADALAALKSNPMFWILSRRNRVPAFTPTRRGRAARRPCNARTRGSRRVTSRSAGGGSSGDDDGEPAPSRLTPRWLDPDSHRLAEAGR